MRFTIAVIVLLMASPSAHAAVKHFPWRSADFFAQCADLDNPHTVDVQRDPLTTAQYGMCARYVEGFEMAAQGHDGIPADCLVNPLILFHSAKGLYDGNKGRNPLPGSYLYMAMSNDCRATR